MSQKKLLVECEDETTNQTTLMKEEWNVMNCVCAKETNERKSRLIFDDIETHHASLTQLSD